VTLLHREREAWKIRLSEEGKQEQMLLGNRNDVTCWGLKLVAARKSFNGVEKTEE
jgi:hypothetical protein